VEQESGAAPSSGGSPTSSEERLRYGAGGETSCSSGMVLASVDGDIPALS